MRLFEQELQVLNVGLASFADEIVQAGGKATHIEWAPPAGGDRAAGRALARLVNNAEVEAANRKAFGAYLAAQPQLAGIGPARDVIPGMNEHRILHAGPPIEWERMCGPMQGAIVGALLFEGWAKDREAAKRLVERGDVAFAPCNHHGAVGPMAGIISPSMPVWIVRDGATGHRTFSNLNEGLGKVLRFGANSPDVIDRLRWIATTLYRVLDAVFAEAGGIELKPLIAQALNMGDEVHNRNAAATSLLLRWLVPAMLRSRASRDDVTSAATFIAGNDHFFLNISMAACKLMLDAARNIPASTMVTAMARNGVAFGIQMSGTGDCWFTAPAPVVDGLYFPGYSMADAAPDLGDSAITETAGLGGFAMAAAPAIVNFVGGTSDDAIANTAAMGHITLGRNGALTLPAMNFSGTPAGIDARKVVDTGILPVINTGIAHREPGIGQIGAGITRAPLDCFAQAVTALAAARQDLKPRSWHKGGTMAGEKKLAVVAVGGNALIRDREHEGIPDQYEAAALTVRGITDMIEAGWNVIVTHGNGPQMGFILRRSELAIHEVAPVPMDYAGADLQGALGYMFVRAFRNEFRKRGIAREPVAVVTETLVDSDDPAFRDPTKPIGSQMDEATAKKLAAAHGWTVKEDAGRGWRRVVPSPRPRKIIDYQAIAYLARAGFVVIGGGGGGIPVVEHADGTLRGVEAVIDKDLASSLLARSIGADLFVLATGVERVALGFNTPRQRWLDRMTLAEARRYDAADEFDRGSMGPKIKALIEFLDGGGSRGLITAPSCLCRALAGETGTVVVP